MKASQLGELLRFRGGMPLVILRDVDSEGRIAAYCGGERVATVGPGNLIGVREQAYLLSYPDSKIEIRGSWRDVAECLSVLQQTASWDEVLELVEAQRAFDEF